MRVLVISSRNLIAGDLARLLKNEGDDVRLFIDDKDRKQSFENIVEKSVDWKQDLDWVGKDGLIVFDDSGYGKAQDSLRKKGYSVFGGNVMSDLLEFDRDYAQEIFVKYGLTPLRTNSFSEVDECIDFVKKSDRPLVLKQNDHKLNVNIVSQLNENQDVLDVLNFCKSLPDNRIDKITLQEKVDGVEVGVGRYFNGKDWVGPIEINFEHKRFFNGDIGPMTTEMGTLGWYDDSEQNLLFQKTIAKLKPYLQEIDFRGDFEINFIVNEDNLYPLEATPRLGSPIIYLQNEIHSSPWGAFLKSIADGKDFRLKWNKGFGIVVLLAVPPFPYAPKIKNVAPKGTGIYFKGLNDDDLRHVYFEGVAKREKDNHSSYYIADNEGYVLYVACLGDTVEKAREKVYNIVNKIHIPKMMYRSDIGVRYIESDFKNLKKWGYLS